MICHWSVDKHINCCQVVKLESRYWLANGWSSGSVSRAACPALLVQVRPHWQCFTSFNMLDPKCKKNNRPPTFCIIKTDMVGEWVEVLSHRNQVKSPDQMSPCVCRFQPGASVSITSKKYPGPQVNVSYLDKQENKKISLSLSLIWTLQLFLNDMTICNKES